MDALPIRLRPLEEADFTDAYLGWFRDAEVTRFLDARNITRADAVQHLLGGRDGARWHLFAVCRTDTGVHVGNLKIGPIHHRHGTSDLVTVIGDRTVWGRGVARAAIREGIALAFGRFGIRKLSASIDSRNTGSIKAYCAAGFTEEARLKDQFLELTDGGPVLSDKVFVGCWNPDWQPPAGY
ncbi:MAG: GNAT family N-acetyltransferase [Rhodospirillaceae bacterium]|nr:GNAT family N-acetyltransferase [Rhodospirillaceae bacterium]